MWSKEASTFSDVLEKFLSLSSHWRSFATACFSHPMCMQVSSSHLCFCAGSLVWAHRLSYSEPKLLGSLLPCRPSEVLKLEGRIEKLSQNMWLGLFKFKLKSKCILQNSDQIALPVLFWPPSCTFLGLEVFTFPNHYESSDLPTPAEFHGYHDVLWMLNTDLVRTFC